MNKALRITLIVIGSLVLAGGLIFTGYWIGGRVTSTSSVPVRAYNGYGPMMGNDRGYGPGGDRGFGMTNAPALRSGVCAGVGGRRGYGGMMGQGGGYGGMMGGYGGTTSNATPLTVDQAYQAASKYLASLNNTDLKIAEVMVFDNNAYVRVVEQSTGIGAFELLVDPATQNVYPEHGPNMMWNLKYGMMSGGRGGMGGMMGFYNQGDTASDPAAMTVSADQALKDAQTWLDKNMSGARTATDADPFYGYYTIDILKDGKTVGMLSVNGFSGQVFYHSWHGTFISSQDY